MAKKNAASEPFYRVQGIKALVLVDELHLDKQKKIPNRFYALSEQLNQGGVTVSLAIVSSLSSLKTALKESAPDIVFSAGYSITDAHGAQLVIHELLDRLGLAYVGSHAGVLETVLSKVALKRLWDSAAIEKAEHSIPWRN